MFEDRPSYRFREIFYYTKWVVCGLVFLIYGLSFYGGFYSLWNATIFVSVTLLGHGILWILKSNEDSNESRYWERKAEERKMSEQRKTDQVKQ